jgi:hypothetical protein
MGQVQNLEQLIRVCYWYCLFFLIQIFRTSLVLVRIRASPAMVSVCDLAKQNLMNKIWPKICRFGSAKLGNFTVVGKGPP